MNKNSLSITLKKKKKKKKKTKAFAKQDIYPVQNFPALNMA
jgi:hypothetical protein